MHKKRRVSKFELPAILPGIMSVFEQRKKMPVICRVGRKAIAELLAIEEQNEHASWTEWVFQSTFDSAVARVYAARLGGQIVGFLALHLVCDEVQIQNICLLPAFRGQGTGKALLQYALEECAADGARSAFLEVRVGNVVAKGLYQSLGFDIVTVRPQYYCDNQEDAFVMRADLLQFLTEKTGSTGGSL